MTVRAQNRTPAALAGGRPRPARAFTQAELRDRRRAGLLHTYGGGWSLTAEVGAVCAPLAERIAATPNPAAYWRPVDAVALAVHGLVHTAVGLLAERDAQRQTRHLGVDERGRSIRALVDLAERPALPEITDADLTDGTWSARLVVLADPYSADLAHLLGNALTTAVSDRLFAPLREVDATALSLARRLDRDDQTRAERAAKNPTPTETDRARAELAALGITP